MSRFKERIRKRISLLEPVDIPELRLFQRATFGGGDVIQSSETHHHWLFDGNPYNDGNTPQFWIYRDEQGAIQGQQGGIPFRLWTGKQSWRASWGIDLMVSPPYRVRGIGAVLNEHYVEQNEVTAAIGITEAARKAHLRAGWMDLGTIPLYARPLSPAGILAGFPDNKVKGAAATALGYPLLRLMESIGVIHARTKKARLEPVERFDERSDQVWEKAKEDYPILAERNLDYLRWRFDSAPKTNDYRRYYLYLKDELKGYAVIRLGKRGERPVAALCDFLCPASCQKAMFALTIRAAREEGASDLHCAVLSPHIRENEMKRLGFIPLSLRSRFMVTTHPEKGPPRALLSNPNNWFITMANSDMEWMYLDE